LVHPSDVKSAPTASGPSTSSAASAASDRKTASASKGINNFGESATYADDKKKPLPESAAAAPKPTKKKPTKLSKIEDRYLRYLTALLRSTCESLDLENSDLDRERIERWGPGGGYLRTRRDTCKRLERWGTERVELRSMERGE
jgi:hypothetical protein